MVSRGENQAAAAGEWRSGKRQSKNQQRRHDSIKRQQRRQQHLDEKQQHAVSHHSKYMSCSLHSINVDQHGNRCAGGGGMACVN